MSKKVFFSFIPLSKTLIIGNFEVGKSKVVAFYAIRHTGEAEV